MQWLIGYGRFFTMGGSIAGCWMSSPKDTIKLPKIDDVDDVDEPATIRLDKLVDLDAPTQERRRAPRARARLAVTVVAGARTEAFVIEDVSVTGARMTGPLTLACDDAIRITLALDDIRVEVDAVVVRVSTADLLHDHIAVRFVDDANPQIAALVARLLNDGA